MIQEQLRTVSILVSIVILSIKAQYFKGNHLCRVIQALSNNFDIANTKLSIFIATGQVLPQLSLNF